MPVGLFIVILLLSVFAVFLGVVMVGFIRDDSRSDAKTLRANLLNSRHREKVATKALRSIVNDAGNPILEAQDALDEIESSYTKELS